MLPPEKKEMGNAWSFFLINNKDFIERNLQPYSEGYKTLQ